MICILILIIVGKSVFTNKKSSNRDLRSPKIDLNDSTEEDCPPMDKFLAAHPDATSEEMYEIEQCNKERAASLGLDKPNTGFLGNTYSRPEGALAHYEGSGGRMIFTVFEEHIFANSSGVDSDSIEIPFSAVESIEEAWDMPGTINIEYQTENGTMMQYSITILNPSDDLKAEGARDLDRLIALLEEQRDKSE